MRLSYITLALMLASSPLLASDAEECRELKRELTSFKKDYKEYKKDGELDKADKKETLSDLAEMRNSIREVLDDSESDRKEKAMAKAAMQANRSAAAAVKSGDYKSFMKNLKRLKKFFEWYTEYQDC